MKEDEFDAVDLTPLDPSADPAGWQRVVDVTLARVDGALEARERAAREAHQPVGARLRPLLRARVGRGEGHRYGGRRHRNSRVTLHGTAPFSW